MNAVVSVCLLACALGIIVYLLSRRETTRRSQYGPAGLSEFRTGLALDECFDRLDSRSDTDLFAYECRRYFTNLLIASFKSFNTCSSPVSIASTRQWLM